MFVWKAMALASILQPRRELKVFVLKAKAQYILQEKIERTTMIDIDMLESNWKHLRGQVRQHWKALTDDDVDRIEGHSDVLVDLLRERYGYSKAYAEDEVVRFIEAELDRAVH
jgi:uncharacterized protein YjbJ (UPF0337 family)